LIELLIAPKYAWKGFAIRHEGLGPWTGFSQHQDGTYFVQLGCDTDETTIEGSLNHEILHIVLHKLGEDHSCLDRIYWGYEGFISIPRRVKKFLDGLSCYGLGF